MKRGFFYSPLWMAERNKLPGRRPAGAPDENSTADIDLVAIDLSPRGRLDGFVETFVAGYPRAMLVRPQGYGMDPPFHRMRSPRQAAVEMRTADTRTFGFFVKRGVFVAHRLALADDTHADTALYGIHGDAVLTLMARMSSTDTDERSPVDDLVGDCPDE
jgi:hypothetical protein